jgi:hypothetical protein
MAMQFENGSGFSTEQPNAAGTPPNNNSNTANGMPADQQIFKRPNTWTFTGSNVMGAVMAKDVGSEIYAAFKKIMTEMSKEQNKSGSGITSYVIDFDNRNFPAMSFSSIIVATGIMTETGLHVAFIPLLLEATGKLDETANEYINGQNVQINVTTSHAINSRYIEAAINAVRNAVPSAAVVRYTNAITVARTFSKDDETGIKALMYQATLATNTKNIMAQPDFFDMNLPQTARASGGNLVIKTICSPAEVIKDVAGGMRRSDFKLTLTRETRVNGNRSVIGNLNSPDASTTIADVACYVDLVYSDPMAAMNGVGMGYMNQQQMMAMTQKYFARIVVTDVQCMMAMTPAMILMALFLPTAMRDSYAWMRAFMPLKERTSEASRRKLDIRDIGALNVEANIYGNNGSIAGAPIDLFHNIDPVTGAKTYIGAPSAADVGNLLTRLVRPQVVLSVDIPRSSMSTSFLDLVRQASDDQHNGKILESEAYRTLWNSFNCLTNGNWEKHFPLGKQMFVDTNNIQLEGNYTDTDGQVRPISEIDHVAICSIFQDNPMQIRFWSDTFLDQNVQIEQRLAVRRKMLKEAIPTAEVTGLIDRVTFDGPVWVAYDKAMLECGVPFDLQSNYTSQDLGAPRLGPAWAASAVVGVGGGYARAGFNNYNGGTGYYNAAVY